MHYKALVFSNRAICFPINLLNLFGQTETTAGMTVRFAIFMREFSQSAIGIHEKFEWVYTNITTNHSEIN